MQVETAGMPSQAQGTGRHQELEEAGRIPTNLWREQGPAHTSLMSDSWGSGRANMLC